MGSVLLVLQLITAIFLVIVILLQRSNGSALSGLGGDNSVGGLISARGKGNILTRITAVLATLFFALSLAISIHYSHLEVKTKSILDSSTEQTSEAPAETLPQVPVSENEDTVADKPYEATNTTASSTNTEGNTKPVEQNNPETK